MMVDAACPQLDISLIRGHQSVELNASKLGYAM